MSEASLLFVVNKCVCVKSIWTHRRRSAVFYYASQSHRRRQENILLRTMMLVAKKIHFDFFFNTYTIALQFYYSILYIVFRLIRFYSFFRVV